MEEQRVHDHVPGTCLAGQIRTLSDHPLGGVTVRIGDRTVRSDETGSFLLESIGHGHRGLLIDGRTASGSGRVYGMFEVGIDLRPGRMNRLPFTVWMPEIDTDNAVEIPSPTVANVVVTTPGVPGLEIHLPPGTIIRDRDAKVVTQVTVTPIPVDRPPFPLPFGAEFPMYFTVQPGGAYIEPYGARIVYPNVKRRPPGTRTDFWSYDPEAERWHMYGRGTVTPDGEQVVPDGGVVVYRLTGSSIKEHENGPKPGGGSGGFAPGPSPSDGDPVDLGTGLAVFEKTDLFLPDVIPIAVKRTHRPGGPRGVRPFGLGSSHMYELAIFVDDNLQEADLMLPHGGLVRYTALPQSSATTDPVFEHAATPSIFFKSLLRHERRRWSLTLKNGTVYTFNDGAIPLLQSIEDRSGNRVTIGRLGGKHGKVTRVTSPNGRWLEFTLDTEGIAGKVDQVRDNIGRTVAYDYDDKTRLTRVVDVMGGETEYTYDDSDRLLTVTDPRGVVFLNYEYDDADRCVRETEADGSSYQFAYTESVPERIVETQVTGPRGHIRRVTFNDDGYIITDTQALGTPDEQTIIYERDPATNLLLSVTDGMGRKTAQTYDEMANVATIVRLAGRPESVTTQLSYESNFNQVATITGPLNLGMTVSYDDEGAPIAFNSGGGSIANVTNNPAGQPVEISDAEGNTAHLGYAFGLQSTLVDPRGAVNSWALDGAGRKVSRTDPLGRTSRFDYDAHNHLAKLTDPSGSVTAFSYDANGNLVSVTDPRGSQTEYTYDEMDRVIRRTDPLGHSDTYLYDPAGNITQHVDRKGQRMGFNHDALNRLVRVEDADGATIAYEWDAANRLTQVIDSISGTVTFEYGADDQIIVVSTPEGSTTYGYDAAGRRTSMAVQGESPVTYIYDNENRLTQITQGSTAIAIEFDSVGRAVRVSLPHEVVTEYEHDTASRLSRIVFKQAAGVLGDLTYEYDAAGQRTKVGGSLARVIIPEPVAFTAYDAANRLIGHGTNNLTYDANGNLETDGVTSYGWDARNQLTSISGPRATASFRYDAFGRRIGKTVNGTTTEYLYDFLNVVQELSAGAPTANVLTGLGVDEYLIRTDADGLMIFLRDALGSTIGLVGAGAAIRTQYNYEPFGASTVAGEGSTNPFQYTGRENDSGGLLYYRARYYSSALQRFISEDPSRPAAGESNLYVYAMNSPMNFTDPLGLQGVDVMTIADCASMAQKVRERQDQVDTNQRKDPVEGMKDGVEELNRSIADWYECLAPIPVVGAAATSKDEPFQHGAPTHVNPSGPNVGRPPRRRERLPGPRDLEEIADLDDIVKDVKDFLGKRPFR